MVESKKGGFTLVELIVVITILAILGTIAFISLQGYSSDARDSKRVSELNILTEGFEILTLMAGRGTYPDDYVTLSLSGETIGYQGSAGKNVLKTFNIFNGGKDPKDENYYTYYLNGNKTKAQFLTMLENDNPLASSSLGIINNSFAATDYTKRVPFTKGIGLGLLLDENNTPINQDEAIKSSGTFETLSASYAGKIVQPIFDSSQLHKTKALYVGGQLLLKSQEKNYSINKSCPTNFIEVPGNNSLGQPDFCVGKYEASSSGTSTGALLTLEGTAPVTLYNAAIKENTDCRGNGDGYHIMTINEWLTIARNIELQATNWSGNKAGSGYIISGNNGHTITGFSGSTVLNSGDSGNTSNDEKRQLTLSNGEIIWDFIGNVWEIVKPLNINNIDSSSPNEIYNYVNNSILGDELNSDTIDGITANAYTNWADITDQDFRNHFGPQIGTDETQGMGNVLETSNSTKYIYLVGGDNSDAGGDNQNGLYSVIKYHTSYLANAGIRCAYNK